MSIPKYLRKRRGLLELKQNKKWIIWNPYHSKLAAYILGKGENWPFSKKCNVLYLGAAEGNTISFLSKICNNGKIVGVDISPMAMAELVKLSEKKKNVIPFLGDAHFPEKYEIYTGNPDIVYQDIAQSDQIEIFIRNYHFFKPKCGFLMVKSRSMPGREKEIFEKCEDKLENEFNLLEIIKIEKWAKGHKAYYIE